MKAKLRILSEHKLLNDPLYGHIYESILKKIDENQINLPITPTEGMFVDLPGFEDELRISRAEKPLFLCMPTYKISRVTIEKGYVVLSLVEPL